MSITETPVPSARHHPGAADPHRLAAALFRDGPGDPHTRWRDAVADEAFRHRPGRTHRDRHEDAYTRLRVLHAAAGDPTALARDPRGLAALHEWTAIADGAAPTVAGIHYNLFLGSLLDDRVSPPRDLTEHTALRRIGTFLCTERAHGNDAAALETTALHDRARDRFVLHTPTRGAEKFMPNTGPAGGPKSGLVAARLLTDGQDRGVFLFLAELSDRNGPRPGVHTTLLPERSGSPVDHCATRFDHVLLPRTALLQGAHGRLDADTGFRSDIGNPRRRALHALRRVTTGKLCMSAATLGGARAALDVAVRYAQLRTVAGPSAGRRIPLAAHRSHHARLLHATATAYAMTFLHRAATAAWLAHGEDPRTRDAAERLVAAAKGWITWQAREIAIECRERCGARALFPANGLADYPANADGAVTAEGDNLAIWCKAGAEMLFAAAHLPDVPPATGREDVTDPRFLRRLAAAVERQRHTEAREALRRAPEPGALGRWNNASEAALQMVEAHTVGAAAEASAAAAAGVDHPPTRAALTDLAALFLLDRIGPWSGGLLAEGAMTADQVRALGPARRQLTARLAPVLPRLTEAFRTPPAHLAALPLLTRP